MSRLSLLLALAACTADQPAASFDDGLLEGEIALDAMTGGLWAPPPPLSSCTPAARVFDSQRSYASMVQAMADAPAGETLHVCPGQHVGPFIRTSGWPLGIVGMGATAHDVRLEGPPGERAFIFGQNSEEVSFQNVTLAAGDGGIVNGFNLDALFDFENCIVEAGGIALLRGRGLRLRDTILTGAPKVPVQTGIAIFSTGLDPAIPITVMLDNVLIEDAGGPAGLTALTMNTNEHPAGTYLRVRDTIIRDNIGENQTAVSINLDNAWARFERVQLTDNHATHPEDGSGVFDISTERPNWARLDLYEVTATDNSAARWPVLSASYSSLTLRARDPRPTIHVRDSRFYRNQRTGTAQDLPVFDFSPPILVHMDNVDFGTGADTNAAPEFPFCQSTDPGLVRQATMDRIAWHATPPCP